MQINSKPFSTMTYLCVDYGVSHCGIAIGINGLAEPLKTVSTESVFHYLREYITEYKPSKIVIGLSEGEMAVKTKKFASLVSTQFNLQVVFEDETLSSQEVRQEIAQSRMKKSKREAKIDHMVAAKILQDYLDAN